MRDIADLRAALRGQAVPDAAPGDLVVARDQYLSGGMPDWAVLYPEGRFRRVRLPTYPFERRRCWPAAEPAPPARRAGAVSVFDAVIRELGAVR